MRLLKNKSGKGGIAQKSNPYINQMGGNPYSQNSEIPYNSSSDKGYTDQLEHGDLNNNSTNIRGIFSYSDKNFELPSISNPSKVSFSSHIFRHLRARL